MNSTHKLVNKGDRFVEFNHDPTIKMVDKDGDLIAMVSQSQAFRLMNQGLCKLQLVKPLSIQFQLDRAEWKDHYLRPDCKFKALRKTSNFWLPAATKNLYGNFVMQSPDGNPMFCCDQKKALWYLNRDIADIVSADPPVLRFKFVPGGKGHVGDQYFLTEKQNRCVVCGTTENLSRHHVMPYVYRRYFSEEVKQHNHFDILLLCLDCHSTYEKEAGLLKKEICKEFGLTVSDPRLVDSDSGKAVRAAHALIKHGDKIPEERKKTLMECVKGYTNNEEDLTLAELVEISKRTLSFVPEGYKHYGQLVVEKSDIQELTERWRNHFISVMKPAFMPPHWEVSRSIFGDSRTKA